MSRPWYNGHCEFFRCIDYSRRMQKQEMSCLKKNRACWMSANHAGWALVSCSVDHVPPCIVRIGRLSLCNESKLNKWLHLSNHCCRVYKHIDLHACRSHDLMAIASSFRCIDYSRRLQRHDMSCLKIKPCLLNVSEPRWMSFGVMLCWSGHTLPRENC